MKKKLSLSLFLLLQLCLQGYAQQADTLRLSLIEAVNLAVEQNPQLKSTQLNEEKNRYRIKEVKAAALPQLNGDATFTDNFQRATQILPGEVFGQPGTSVAVQFGTQYQMGVTAQASQVLFDPSLIVGIRAAKESQGLYELQTFQTKEDLIYNVVNIYMQLQMVEKQQELVKGNIDRMQQLIYITNEQFKEGIIKKVDVEQLKVNNTNLLTQLSNANNTYVQLINNLKTLMSVPASQPVAITEVGADPIPVLQQLNLEANTELALLDYQMNLQRLNTKNIQAGYLPKLSLIANYGWQGQTNELFETGQTQGFKSGLYGLQLSIPIFDGFAKRSRVVQSNIELRQLELNKQYLASNITNEFVTARNNVLQNQRVQEAQQENMKVAEELYQVAKLSYTEGIAPLSELINAENGLKEAQTQYLTAMLQMNLAELDLMQSSGQLSQIIKETSPVK
ncbi:TolC family protein [Pontibacter sp. E15-1]|uniref:TolC family protein n=1 Tax=Pontibacter sp. E15-1 TaxID=2919918 RepID=UPI001F4F44D1|nr:TolC family protein [Pontibacter sp. E15-1]MCJ8163451.1 TolC family protein [Pontibacter sp. E15-1]